ncbi:tyrosine-type recombinase/integrase [Anaerobacillus sp. MEB173]|uniref:tyrosine-type recombinase/integrase n=1 Tax=Anaerobacillus sp. MEB173 TaxID=3383345 RepID=UPI003F920F6E
MENIKCAGATDGMLNSFSSYLSQNGKSNNTIKTYRGVLYSFCNWLEENNSSIQNVSSKDVQAYMNYLVSEQRSASTINKIYNTIKSFAISINKPELMEKVQRIESTGETAPPECLSNLEIKELLDKVNVDGNKRNAAIVYLLLYTGVRVSELCALNQSDVQISNQTGKLVVKNENGERVIPLSNVCIQHVKEYLESRDDDNEALFLAKNQQRLSVRTVQHTLQQYGVHPHKLRHTFCYELVRKGVDLSIVAQLAGHSDINITKQYIESSEG